MMKQTFAFIGSSGSGKTFLITRLIPLLKEAGLRVAALKHSHHHFQIDQEGKDSAVMASSGAEAVVICSAERLALIRRHRREPSLEELVERYLSDYEVVLAEGFHQSRVPKILVTGSGEERFPLRADRLRQLNVVAVVVPAMIELEEAINIPIFTPDQEFEIVSFLTRWVRTPEA